MLSLVFIAVVTTLAVFTILAKTCAGKTKKAEKWEKGEIIKQLLALSKRENSSSVVAAPPALSPRSYPDPTKPTPKLKKKSANARMSCIKNVAE